MSELSDEIEIGLRCEVCAAFIADDAPGHPRKCNDCDPDRKAARLREHNRRQRRRRLARQGIRK
jgi:hypothetical protein